MASTLASWFSKKFGNREKLDEENMFTHGKALYSKGKIDQAIEIFAVLLKKSQQQGEQHSLRTAHIYEHIAACLHMRGDYPQSRGLYKKALDVYLEKLHINEATRTYLNIGISFHCENNYTDSGVAFLEALCYQKAQRTPNFFLLGNIYVRLGESLFNTSEFQNAFQCFKKGLSNFQASGSKESPYFIVAVEKMAEIYVLQSNVNEGIYFIAEFLASDHNVGWVTNEAKYGLEVILAFLLKKSNQNNKAIKLVIPISRKTHIYTKKALSSLGDLLIEVGDKDSALKVSQKNYQLNKNTKNVGARYRNFLAAQEMDRELTNNWKSRI